MGISGADQYSVSVVIPAYNVAKYIGRAIESVLSQTLPVDEVIVVDDGSTDSTVEIASDFGDKITLIQQSNAGVSSARNAGIKASRSKWVAFLDADDYWLPEKNQKQVENLKLHPDLRWCAANYYRLDGVSQTVAEMPGDIDMLDNYMLSYPKRVQGHTDTMLIQKDLLLEAGLFDESLSRSNDIDMWFRISFLEPKLGYVPEPLTVYQTDISYITKKILDANVPMRLVGKLEAMADNSGHRDEFKPCAGLILKWWIILLVQSKQGSSVRKLLATHHSLFGKRYIFANYVGSFFPATYLKYLKHKIPTLR